MKSGSFYLIAPTIVLLLSACAPALKVQPEIIKQKKVEVIQKKVVEKKPELRVAILLSSSAKAYKNTSRIITKKLNNKAGEYILTGDKNQNISLINNIKSGKYSHVVALGIKAAKYASPIKSKFVIFSHVFNYKEHQFVGDKMKGISALPVPEQLFKDWKALSPNLKSVALVTGNNLEYYVSRVKKTAVKHGVEIFHRVVKNDKEFVYVSKRIPLHVQGHWILPDNRILSRTALKEVMSYNSKNGKQSVVFSKGLLSFGGLFYVSASDAEVARLILNRLDDSLGKKIIPGENILETRKHEVGINKKVASHLGLVIPDHYRKFIRD